MKKPLPVLDKSPSHINLSVDNQKFILNISPKQTKTVKFINDRFRKSIPTTIQDLKPFVKSSKNNNKAAHKLASRLCGTNLIESVHGIYVPKGHGAYLNNLDIKLSKIKTKRKKNKVIKAKKHIIELIRPFITQNKWCLPSTHLTAQFHIPNIFQQLNNLHIFELENNRHLVIPFEDNNLFPNLKITFYIYPTDKVIVQIGNKQNLIQANASIICSALSICYDYLISTIQFWRLGLEIPSYSNWTITIPYIYSNTLNDYTKLNGKIQDDDLGLVLTDEQTHLLLKSKPPQSKFKPKQLHDFLIKYNPLTKFITNSFFENQAQNVTHCKNFEKSPSKKIMES